jgi:hypothetical protein
MNLHHIFSKAVLVAVLMMYICLRTQLQCHVDSSAPHSHFPTIKQKTINVVTQIVTIPDVQPILSTLSTHTEAAYSEPAPLIFSNIYQVSSRASHCSGYFGERSPPTC